MGITLMITGIALLVVTATDALWTTVWIDGRAGPLTNRLSEALWWSTRTVIRSHRHHLLSASGPAILLAVFAMWVTLLLVGWTLIFLSTHGVVLDSHTQQPASGIAQLYFVAYSVFTLGNGDYVPHGGLWQLATAAMAGSGLFLITLAITYLLPVLSAVVEKRTLASQINALGSDATEIVTTAWDGRSFSDLASHLVTLTSSLGRLAEQHLAYPVLDYFHSSDRQKASAPAIANLDEALTILCFAITPQHRPASAVLGPARRSIAAYLDTVASTLPTNAERAPPPPDLTKIREAGIPTVADADFTVVLETLAERRHRLATLVSNDGWTWEER
jgi:Ion channel